MFEFVLNLLSYFHRGIQAGDFCFRQRLDRFCALYQDRQRGEIVIGRKVPEKGRRDSDKRPIWVAKLAFRNGIDGRFVHDHLMEASLDKTPSEMLDLLSCLYEKITTG